MRIVFYEKPGCTTNGRQRKMLTAAGHDVEARNLLTEAWTAERLAVFLGALPVSQWFNRASPRVKSGEIDPARLDGEKAMALLLADPLLIRRPLMEAGDWRCAGFDAAEVDRTIGLALDRAGPVTAPLDGCAHGEDGGHCATPG